MNIHPIQPAELGGTFTLTFGAGVKVWRNETKAVLPDGSSAAVTSGTTEFVATDPTTTLYIEGVGKGVSNIALNWKSTPAAGGAAIEAKSVDQVKVTVYEITGPLNVPGYARYSYNADVPGVAAPGTWTAAGGSATAGAANQCQILWEGGPVIGFAIFKPNAQFQCKRDVNVVQVELDLAKSSITVDKSVKNDSTGSVPHIVSNTNTPMMEATIFIANKKGPTREGSSLSRGVRYVIGSFIQNGEVNQWNAEYGSPSVATTKHRMEALGTWILDIVTDPRSTVPWYSFPNAPTAPLSSDAVTANKSVTVGDKPALDAAGVSNFNRNQLSVNNMLINFRLYVAVQTLDASNDADKIYTQRAVATWHFDGSGNTSTGTWQRLAKRSNAVDSRFAEVATGVTVPVIDGTVMNDRRALGFIPPKNK